MSTIVEIDRAGRVVIPKRMRDALHLMPGTRLQLDEQGDRLILQAEQPARGLYLKRGSLVMDAGPLPPIDINRSIQQVREGRSTITAGEEEPF